jgi:hypothetical protein
VNNFDPGLSNPCTAHPLIKFIRWRFGGLREHLRIGFGFIEYIDIDLKFVLGLRTLPRGRRPSTGPLLLSSPSSRPSGGNF